MLTRIGLLLVILLLSSCGQYTDSQEVTLNGSLVNLEKGLEPLLVLEAPPHWRREVGWAEVSGPDSSFTLKVNLDLKTTKEVQLTVLAKDYESLSTGGVLNGNVVEFPPLELKKFGVSKTGTSREKRKKSLRKSIPQQLDTDKVEPPPAAIDLLQSERTGGSMEPKDLESGVRRE